jgi:hypothetical protein
MAEFRIPTCDHDHDETPMTKVWQMVMGIQYTSARSAGEKCNAEMAQAGGKGTALPLIHRMPRLKKLYSPFSGLAFLCISDGPCG